MSSNSRSIKRRSCHRRKNNSRKSNNRSSKNSNIQYRTVKLLNTGNRKNNNTNFSNRNSSKTGAPTFGLSSSNTNYSKLKASVSGAIAATEKAQRDGIREPITLLDPSAPFPGGHGKKGEEWGEGHTRREGAQKGRGVYRTQRGGRIFVPLSPWLLPSKQVMKGEVDD